MSTQIMVLFQSTRGSVAVVVGKAEDRDALVEKAVRAACSVSRYPVYVDRGGEDLHSVYDGERPYDAECYEPGEYLGVVDVRPVVEGQVEMAA